ncbi:MAG: hypothetical protein COA91_08815 [Robiginitomaculum sp.]|nr:MAG: hypothetical protein COA91_08815 [Robiginitomaculum sp.]
MKKLSPVRYFLILIAVFTLIFMGLSSISHGPKPKSADIALDQFSGERALVHLSDMIGDNKPHPTGSAENRRVLEVLQNKFAALGYETQVQKTLACTTHYPGCSQVENFIAVSIGSGSNHSSGDAIMLTTHYDSVPAAPGAGDAGAGVAALIEVARILKAEPTGSNTVIFLITDGEEGGLRGASGFANEHEWMKNVKLVVNLEARGASGPSTMFETHPGNLALIRQFAKTNKYPVANSLSYEIYKLLPNDTDYSIYRDMGVAGLNFAFTGDVALYHSARDDIAHLDKSSLQHHGENALAAVRAFRDVDLNTLVGESDATYFDVFGRVLLHWPSNLNLPLALWAFIIIAVAANKSRTGWRQDLLAATVLPGVIVLALVFGWLLSWPLGHWPQLFYLDHPYPWPGRLALLFVAALSAWIMARIFRDKNVSYNMLVCLAGVFLAFLSLIVASKMPGASYQFLVPAIALAVGWIVDMLLWRKQERFVWALHLGLISAAYMAVYHFIALEVIASYELSYVRIAPLIPLALLLVPVFMQAGRQDKKNLRLLGFGFGTVAIIATMTSALLPGFNETHPRVQNLVLEVNADTSKARWISETIGGEDKGFLAKAGFSKTRQAIQRFGIYSQNRFTKPADYSKLLAPQFNLLNDKAEGEHRILSVEIAARNNGYGLYLHFPADNRPLTVHINDMLTAEFGPSSKYKDISIRGPGDTTYTVKLVYPKGRKIQLSLEESISILPTQTDGMADLRPANSAPGFYGDRIQIFTTAIFE